METGVLSVRNRGQKGFCAQESLTGLLGNGYRLLKQIQTKMLPIATPSAILPVPQTPGSH